MIKFRSVLVAVLALFASASSLHAQAGCTDSPELPTAVLLLVGSAGMFYGSHILRKLLRPNGK